MSVVMYPIDILWFEESVTIVIRCNPITILLLLEQFGFYTPLITKFHNLLTDIILGAWPDYQWGGEVVYGIMTDHNRGVFHTPVFIC